MKRFLAAAIVSTLALPITGALGTLAHAADQEQIPPNPNIKIDYLPPTKPELIPLYERLKATGAEIRPIPKDVLEFTRKQIDEKRKTPAYSETEWRYHVRLAERLDPSFAE